MLPRIFLAIMVALVVSARSLPPNISNGFYHYDPNSIIQNEKILKLFLRLAENTANRLVRLKAEAKKRYPLGIYEDYVELTRPSSKVNIDSRLLNNELTILPEEPLNWRTEVYQGDVNSYVPKMIEIKNGGFETRRSQGGVPEDEVYKRNESFSDLKERPVLKEKITRFSQERRLEDEPDVRGKVNVKSEETLSHEDVLEEKQEDDPSEVEGRATMDDPNARSRLFLNIGNNNHATNDTDRSAMINNVNIPGIQASGTIDLNVGLRTKDQSNIEDSSGYLKKAITDVSRLKNSAFINQDVGLKVNTLIPLLGSTSNQEDNDNIKSSVSGDGLIRNVLQDGSNHNTGSKETSGLSTVKLSGGLWIGDRSSNRNGVDTVVPNAGLQDGSALLTHQDISSEVKVSLPGQGLLLNENKGTDWWNKEVNAEVEASNPDVNSGGSTIVNQDAGFKTIVNVDGMTNLKNNFTGLINVDKIIESEQKVMPGAQMPSSGYFNLNGWPGESTLMENAGEHSSGLPKSIHQPSNTQVQWGPGNVENANIHWMRPKYSKLEDLEDKISKNKQHQVAVQVLDSLQPAEKVRIDHGLSRLNSNGDYAMNNIENGRVTGIVVSGDSVLPSYLQQSKQKVSFNPGKSSLELTKDSTLSIAPEDDTKQQNWKQRRLVNVQGAIEQIQGVIRPKKNLLLGIVEESKNNHVKIDPWTLRGPIYNVETLKNPSSTAGHVQAQNQRTIYYPSGSDGTHSFTNQNNVGTTVDNIAHHINTPLIFVHNTGSGSLPVSSVQDMSWNTNNAVIGLGNTEHVAEDTAIGKHNLGSGFLTLDKLGTNSAVGSQNHFGVEVTKTLSLADEPREKDPWVLRGQIDVGHSKTSLPQQQEERVQTDQGLSRRKLDLKSDQMIGLYHGRMNEKVN